MLCLIVNLYLLTVLQAAGPITHPWLDQFKQVNGSEKVIVIADSYVSRSYLMFTVALVQLMSWTRHSSLVEVVEESLSAVSAPIIYSTAAIKLFNSLQSCVEIIVADRHQLGRIS